MKINKIESYGWQISTFHNSIYYFRSCSIFKLGAMRIVYKVLNRNKWSEKLIVCDLTGSMMPYASQLSLWYQLNVAKEKNLQFVFFNDGDSKLHSQKKIGANE